MLTAEAENEP